jgi:hypothetical protein
VDDHWQVGLNGQSQAAVSICRGPGRGVAVLLEIYRHCIGGKADAANQRIIEALGIQDTTRPESESGNGGDDDSGQEPEMAGQRLEA